jgi:hypothetical protein
LKFLKKRVCRPDSVIEPFSLHEEEVGKNVVGGGVAEVGESFASKENTGV